MALPDILFGQDRKTSMSVLGLGAGKPGGIDPMSDGPWSMHSITSCARKTMPGFLRCNLLFVPGSS